MEIIKGILIVLHIVGFGAVFGSSLAQLTAVKQGAARITPGIFHGLNTMFVTGLLLVMMRYLMADPMSDAPVVNNLKITLKMAVLIVMIAITLLNRKKENLPAGVFGAIAGLGVLNVALAVMWH